MTKVPNPALKQLRGTLKKALKEESEIPQSLFLQWVQVGRDDLSTLGLLFALSSGASYRRIKPELSMKDCCDFIRHFFLSCLKENPRSSKYLCNRYEAAWAIVSWFRHLHKEVKKTEPVLIETAREIKELYLKSDQEIQLAICNGFLEHVFETPALRKYFADWKDDPRMSEDYKWAMMWGKDHEGKDWGTF